MARVREPQVQAVPLEREQTPGSMKRPSLFVWALGLLAFLCVGTGLAAYLLPDNEPLLLVSAALAAAAGAFVLRGKLRAEARRLALAARSLPDWDTNAAQPGWSGELADSAEELRSASERISKRLNRLQEERLQLEALLDSMQDAVVAVDSAGRIQWTNRAMQGMVPDVYSRSAVRVGQALVHTVRDPEVLDCVKTALESRALCEKKTSRTSASGLRSTANFAVPTSCKRNALMACAATTAASWRG